MKKSLFLILLLLIPSTIYSKTLIVSTPYTLTDSLSIPSTVILKIENSGLFSIPSTKTLTINGPVDIPIFRSFSGAGTVAGLKEAKILWFGRNTSPGTTDMVNAAQAAIDSVGSNGRIHLDNSKYAISDELKILNKTGLTISGPGELTQLDATKSAIHVSGSADVLVENFTINGLIDSADVTTADNIIRVDPNLTGTAAVNSNIRIDKITFKKNATNAVYLGRNNTTYGDQYNIKITNCTMDGGLSFMLAANARDLIVDGIYISHRTTAVTGSSFSQDEDIGLWAFATNNMNMENITISNVIIESNGTTTNTYTGRRKISVSVGVGYYARNITFNNITIKDNIGQFTTAGNTSSSINITDGNADKQHIISLVLNNISTYNSPGIFIEANNVQFNNITLDTFPVIAGYVYGEAIMSAAAISTAGCVFNNIKVLNWNFGDPVIYTAEGGVTFNNLTVKNSNGAVWAAANSVYTNVYLDDVGETTHGSFWVPSSSTANISVSNLSIVNAPFTGLKENTSSRATGATLNGAVFYNNAVDTNILANDSNSSWAISGVAGAGIYADQAAAAAGGVAVGSFYRTSQSAAYKFGVRE